MKRHDWEDTDPEWEPSTSGGGGARHSWEDGGGGERGHGSDDDTAYSGSDLDEAAREPTPAEDFIEYCTNLLMARHINAKQFCHIMNFAGRVGCRCIAFGHSFRALPEKSESSTGTRTRRKRLVHDQHAPLLEEDDEPRAPGVARIRAP